MPLLLLDLDNTVADRDAAFAYWMVRKLPDWAAEEHAARAFLVEQDADGTRPRTEFLGMVQDRFGLNTPVEALRVEYRRLTLAGFPAMPAGVRERLVSMRQHGWKIAVVTNGEAGVQEATVERIGLESLLDACVVSGAIGIRKPDPRIFELAAEICEESLDDAWMVGDGEVDVIGARRAGVPSVWLRRGREWKRADVLPDFVADGLEDALRRVTLSDVDRPGGGHPG